MAANKPRQRFLDEKSALDTLPIFITMSSQTARLGTVTRRVQQVMLPPLFPSVVRNVIYPIYRGLRGDRLLTMLEELERNQWLSKEELEELQWRNLVHFLGLVVTHVPYYRKLFGEAGLAIEEINNPGDLRKIPFLTRDIIRRESNQLITTDPLRRGYPSSTGGSTGEPLYFFNDQAAGPLRRANTLRGSRWAMVDIGDKQAIFWGFSLDRPAKNRAAESIKNYFNNILPLSTFDMSDDTMKQYISRLRFYKPDYIIGYPSALAIFAEYCKRNSIRISYPKAVITSGERVFPSQREIIEEVFSCSVFDRYGSREFSSVAHECKERRGLHIFSDLFFVEVIHESGRPAESGEVGELVVTDLNNLYMPFVRYRTGDLAVPTDRTCACGRGFPLLDRIEGRAFDFIVTPSGKRVGGFFWTWLSRAVPGIKQFQIEQRSRGEVTFRIVPGPDWDNGNQQILEEKIKETCGESFRVKFMIADEIPLTPSGKSKFIISNLEERLVVKSKIHKATITGANEDGLDCLTIDEKLMEYGNLVPNEQVLIVDNTNGARIETVVLPGERGSGKIVIGGAASRHVHEGDEVSIMAFTWSDDIHSEFSNVLVDENNRFLRYLIEKAGDKL